MGADSVVEYATCACRPHTISPESSPKRGSIGPSEAGAPIYSRRVIGAEPLTGRDSELGVIRRALSGAGNQCGVVIAGAAGVGKTWLAREVLRRAEASGER